MSSPVPGGGEPIPGMSVGAAPTQGEGQSFFDAVGGHETFAGIVRRFYDGVRADEVPVSYTHLTLPTNREV